MSVAVTVDVAGGPMGGAARYRAEFYRYLTRSARADVRVIGTDRRVSPLWLMRREISVPPRHRRIALNNVGFVGPGGERWTLLGNALHFLGAGEEQDLEPSLAATASRQATVVRAAARRSDVLIVPSTAMAERVLSVLPDANSRVVVRMHPLSADRVRHPDASAVICPVIFGSYKHMPERLAEWVAAVDQCLDPCVRMLVTAGPHEVPPELAASGRLEFVGQLMDEPMRAVWDRARAVFFPPGLESFGFPLAEARVAGLPVIARDTEQNREIAGPALCGFMVGDPDSLLSATQRALATELAPDPAPFDPDAYFGWLLGSAG
jgi:glycosyltransferase involved in cell wall biosynthesis